LTSEFLANKWLTGLLNEPLWLGLTTGEGQEIAAPGYARVQVNGKFAPPQGRSTGNTEQIVFVKAEGDWPDVTGVCTYDAPEGGNELLHGAIAGPQQIQAGVRPVFDPGDIELAIA
jgi:hypothetical protein